MYIFFNIEKTVSLNQRNISLIYGQWKNFFELKKFFLIQKIFLRSKEIDLFTLKNISFDQQKFLQFKEIFPLIVYRRNVSLIQRNCFLGVIQKNTIENSKLNFLTKICEIRKKRRNAKLFVSIRSTNVVWHHFW